MFTPTEIGFEIDKNPHACADKLIAELEKHGGNVVHTALAMRVHQATFKRWIARLAETTNIRDRLEAIRAASGRGPTMTAEQKLKIEQENRRVRQNEELVALFLALTPQQKCMIASDLKTTTSHLDRQVRLIHKIPVDSQLHTALQQLKLAGEVKRPARKPPK